MNQLVSSRKFIVSYLRSLAFLFVLFSWSQLSVALEPGSFPIMESYSRDDIPELVDCLHIAQDEDSVMYFVASSAFLAFDGTRWTNLISQQGLDLAYVNIDDKGRILYTSYADFGYLEPDPENLGRYRKNSYYDRLPEAFSDISLFREVRFSGGNAYIRALGHFVEISKTGDVRVWEVDGVSSAIFSLDEGIFMASNESGLYRLVGDDLKQVPGGEFFVGERAILNGVDSDKGFTLFVTARDGVYRFDGQAFSKIATNIDDELAASSSRMRIVSDFESVIAIGKDGFGIFVCDLDGNELFRMDGSTGLIDSKFKAVYLDQSRNLWVAVRNGVTRVDIDSPFSIWDRRNSPLDAVVSAAVVNDVIYIAGDKGSVYKKSVYENGGFEQVDLGAPVGDIAAFGDGLLYGRSDSKTLYYKDKYGLETSLQVGDLSNFQLFPFSFDTSRSFVRRRRKLGVLELVEGEIEIVNENLGLKEWFYEIVWTSPTVAWALSRPGEILKIEEVAPNEFVSLRYGEAEGVPQNWCRLAVRDGELLLFSKLGFFKYNKTTDRFEVNQAIEGVPLEEMLDFSKVHIDQSGYLWIVTFDDLFRLAPEYGGRFILESYFRSILSKWRISGFFDGAKEDIWLEMPSGIMKVDMDVGANYKQPFKTLIRRVDSLGYPESYVTETMHAERLPPLPYLKRNLRVDLAAPSYVAPEQNAFRYRLSKYRGESGSWSSWDRTPSIPLTDLWEGEYVLEAQARNFAGQVGETATLRFSVLAPWFRSYWAYALYIIGIPGLIWLLVLWRARSLERRAAGLEAIVESRTEVIRQQARSLRSKNVQLSETIQKQKEVEADLLRAKEAAEAADRAKGNFLAMMSHEIRTPLNAITGFSDILMLAKDEEEKTACASQIRQGTDTLLEIVGDILEYSQLNSGVDFEIVQQSFSAHEMLETPVRLLEPLAKERGLLLAYDISESVPRRLVGDVKRICQVLTNLSHNAIKFTKEGEVRVSISGKQIEEAVKFRLRCDVKDSGMGIPEEKLESIFKPFEQVDTSSTREFGGTGLGLSICKALLNKMKGRIWCESDPGHGSVFSFEVDCGLSNDGDSEASNLCSSGR